MDIISKVCIIGRPNVGKSTLFNALAKKRLSVVDPLAGTTRDSVSIYLQKDETFFELVDTGGIMDDNKDTISQAVQKQVDNAIATADVIVFVVDVRNGITPVDKTIANRLRKNKTPIILVANKADNLRFEQDAPEFYKLGLGEPIAVSALHKIGSTDLMNRILELIPESNQPDAFKDILKIAFIGRRNAGKSTLLNKITGQKRVVVSEIPGTTRDAINILIEKDGKKLLLLDTPGLRKMARVDTSVEFFSRFRAEKAVRFADVVFFLLDATQSISIVDKHIAEFLDHQYKPCIILLNKWDLVKQSNPKFTPQDFLKYLGSSLPNLLFAPVSGISALTGMNLNETMELAYELHTQARIRITTSELNKIIEKSVKAYAPFSKSRIEPKIYYGTQVSISPPTIVLSVNRPDLFSPDYKRYILNKFRESLPFSEIPFRVLFRRA